MIIAPSSDLNWVFTKIFIDKSDLETLICSSIWIYREKTLSEHEFTKMAAVNMSITPSTGNKSAIHLLNLQKIIFHSNKIYLHNR